MGKHSGTRAKTVTRVLYKRSNITIRTHSRSGSDTSQLPKGNILQIKKELSKSTDYYNDGNKVKRDLSIETGACMLRRYFKNKYKRDRCSVNAASAKSRCSTIRTEFTEYKHDHASGDSRNKFEKRDTANALNINITSLMVENLNRLLNDWVRQHVLEDTETKKKLANALDSILQSLDIRTASTRSSCCTYVIERNGKGYKVKNKKTETNSITCQYCKQKQNSFITNASSSVLFKKYSRFTIPFPYKHLRIISTLSIPRNMYKKEKSRNKHLIYKVKKTPRANVARMNDKKDRKVIINVSSYAMSTITRKNGQRCLQSQENKSPNKKRAIIFFPQMFYKSATNFTSTTDINDKNKNVETQQNQLDDMPSLVKSLYADDPANVTSTDHVKSSDNRNDNFTMTEANFSHLNPTKMINTVSNVQFHEAKYECHNRTTKTPNIVNQRFESHAKVDFFNQCFEFPNLTITEQNSLVKNSNKERHATKRKSRKRHTKTTRTCKYHRKMTPRRNAKFTYESVKYKQFTYLFKKAKHGVKRDGDFVKHLRNIFKYFSNHEGKRNMKLEIHCNVYPFFEMEENYLNTGSKSYQEYEINVAPREVCNIIPESKANIFEPEEKYENTKMTPKLNTEPNIIPILDGAASQAKYIFKSDNSTGPSRHSISEIEGNEKGTLMTSLEVTKELSELKLAIKDFSATAEKLVQEHLKSRSYQNSLSPSKEPVNLNSANKSYLENIDEKATKSSNVSKGIQFSNTTKGQLLSGIKLSKSPKKVDNMPNINSKLKKRSSSYHVIDSESILKVTDMLTASADKSNDSNVNKQCLKKKSKSLLNITNEANRQKLIAFFCNNNGRKHNMISFKVCPVDNSSIACCPEEPPQSPCNMCNAPCPSVSKLMLPVNISDYQGCGHDYCSSVYVDIDKPTIVVKKKDGLPCWEGLMYCILLWIPVIVVIVLFYHYVLKDLSSSPKESFSETTKKLKLRMNTDFPVAEPNSSRYLLKLSDFGF